MNDYPTGQRTISWVSVTITLTITLLTLLALVLRLRHLGDASLWFDEGVSAQFATMPVHEWLRFLWHGEANMLPYYLLLRGWLVLGHSDFMVRLPSVLFGAATIPVIYALGRRLSGALAGVIAAGLLAVHSFHVSYSQEARSYSMVIFLLSLSWLALAHVVERDGGRQRRLYLITAGLAIYAHFFAGMVVVSQWIAVRCFAPRDTVERLRKLQWVTAAIATPAVLYGLAHHSLLKWIPPVSYGGALYSAVVFSGNGPHLPETFALLVVFAIAFAAITVAKNGRSLPGWNEAAPICWLLFTPLLLIVISAVQPVLVTRYLSLALPALVIVAATALTKLRPLAASALAIVLSLMLLQAALGSDNLDRPHQDWCGAARYLSVHALTGDGAIFLPDIGRAPFDWYWQQQRAKEQILFPGRGAGFTLPAAHRPPESSLEAVIAAPPPRTWSVLAVPDGDPQAARFRRELSSIYPYSCEHQLKEIRIVLYSKGSVECPLE